MTYDTAKQILEENDAAIVSIECKINKHKNGPNRRVNIACLEKDLVQHQTRGVVLTTALADIVREEEEKLRRMKLELTYRKDEEQAEAKVEARRAECAAEDAAEAVNKERIERALETTPSANVVDIDQRRYSMATQKYRDTITNIDHLEANWKSLYNANGHIKTPELVAIEMTICNHRRFGDALKEQMSYFEEAWAAAEEGSNLQDWQSILYVCIKDVDELLRVGPV